MLRTILLLALGAVAQDAPRLGDALARQGLGYAGKRAYGAPEERAWGEGGSRRLSASAGPVRLKVSSEPDADLPAARRRLGEWAARFLGQYDGDAAYPGMVTREVAAPPATTPPPSPGRPAWTRPSASTAASTCTPPPPPSAASRRPCPRRRPG